MKRRSIVGALAVGISLLIARPASAQPTAKVIGAFDDGSFNVVIGNDTLRAITLKMARAFADSQSALMRARGEIRARDTLITQLRLTVQRGDTVIRRFDQYTKTLQEQVDGYKKLSDMIEKYNSAGSRLSFEVGGGLSGSSNPAVVAGVGLRRLRAWTFIQKSNFGGIVGASFPVW